MIKCLSLCLAGFIFAYPSFAQSNNAVDDAFDIDADSVLSIGAPGLLDNDEIALDDSFFVVLVDAPANGTLEINADGTFSYQPDEGFSGTDSFTYLLETLPYQSVTFDTSQSSIDINIDLNVILSSMTDSASGRVAGSADLMLSPLNGTISSAQIMDMDASIIDTMSLFYNFGGGNIIAVSTDTNAFVLDLIEPGPEAPVTGGSFEQTDNLVSLIGKTLVLGGGLFESIIFDAIPDSSLVFDIENTTELAASITQQNDELTLTTSYTLQDTLILEGGLVTAIMDVTGELVGTGPVVQPDQSNVATVSITVNPLSNTSVEDEVPFSYALAQNYPNPFNPTTAISFALPATGHVTLRVYDTLGREVKTLVDGVMPIGQHEVLFEADGLPSGMYLYRMESGDFNASRTLMLVK